MKPILAIALTALLAGCSAQPVALQPGAETVKIGKDDPGAGYTYVGEVSGISGSGCGLFGTKGSFADSAKAMRNEASAIGADYVQIMTQTKPGHGGSAESGCYRNAYQIDGTAYKSK
jgi:hypothetical protein